MANRVTWNADSTAAYLVDATGKIIGQWFKNHPELNTFDPSQYGYAPPTAVAAPPRGGETGYTSQVSQGTSTAGGGFYFDPDKTELDLEFDKLDLDYADREKVRDANRYEFDKQLAADIAANKAAEAGANARAASAAAAGMEQARISAEGQAEVARINGENMARVAAMDNASLEHIADEDLVMRLKEMQSREREWAATTAAQPINYRVYENWLASQPGQADVSGLPAGAPLWDTGAGTTGVAGGTTPTADVYGQQLAAGQRVPEFNAWGGPTTDVGGTPWQAPHETNLTQFSNMPWQAQQMAYARWRERGIFPETAQQIMTAAAPTGSAKNVVAYG